MKQIALTQGKFALVDDEDFEYLNQWKWYCEPHRKTYYAVRRIRLPGNKRKTVRMHRLIMNAPSNMLVDHIHGNGLDNRRSELRLCTDGQNKMNRGKSDTKKGLKGAYWQKQIGRWYSRISLNGNSLYLGTFKTEIEAAKAYDAAAIKYHGEFAGLNNV